MMWRLNDEHPRYALFMPLRFTSFNLRLLLPSTVRLSHHVGSSLRSLGHSLPLSPYTHILDLEVKEAEANAVRRSGMSRERWDVRVRT